MSITPVNRAKNTITPSKKPKYGIATWGDTVATWGDAIYAWGYDGETFADRAKHTITPANRDKN